MSIISRWCCFWLVTSITAQAGQPAPDVAYKALLFGNNAYEAAPLKNPVNDAQGLAERLKLLGFTVTVSYDTTLKEMEKQISHFSQEIKKNDVALFYYSGHGFQIDNENFLVPVDYSGTVLSDIDAKYQAFSVSRILDTIAARSPRLTILILDACRTGLPTGARSMKAGWAAINGVAGSVIAFATSPGQTASDNPGGAHGLFTQQLLEYLGRQDLTLDQLFNQVRMDVYRESGGHQIPSVSSALLDEFSFKRLPVSIGLIENSVPRDQGQDNSTVGTKGLEASADRSLRTSGSPMVQGIADRNRVVVSEIQDRDAVRSLLHRALSSLELGEIATVLQDTGRVLSFDPENQDARRARGRALILSREYDKAIEELSACIRQHPLDVVAFYYRSVAYTGKSDLLSAWEDATAAIVRSPQYADAYLSRSIVLLASGRFKEAIEDATQALKYNLDLGLAYTVRGNALRAMGQPAAAEQDFSMSSLRIRRDLMEGGASRSLDHER